MVFKLMPHKFNGIKVWTLWRCSPPIKNSPSYLYVSDCCLVESDSLWENVMKWREAKFFSNVRQLSVKRPWERFPFIVVLLSTESAWTAEETSTILLSKFQLLHFLQFVIFVTACSLLPSILWYVLCCDDLTFPVRHAQQIEAGIPSRTGC